MLITPQPTTCIRLADGVNQLDCDSHPSESIEQLFDMAIGEYADSEQKKHDALIDASRNSITAQNNEDHETFMSMLRQDSGE